MPVRPTKLEAGDLVEADRSQTLASAPVATLEAQAASGQKRMPDEAVAPLRPRHRVARGFVHRRIVAAASVQPLTPALSPSDAAREANASIPVSTAPPVAFPPLAAQTAAEPPKPESFEMRLGTYWFVRIGIVAMLTALVFFGAYAYQNYIGRIGPGGKVALLYLASGVLLGVGLWFQRRAAKESLRNYAQVLVAGGMAAERGLVQLGHEGFPGEGGGLPCRMPPS